MHPKECENLIAQLLAELGANIVEVTKLSCDGAIDICSGQ